MTNDQPIAVLGATGARGGPVARALLDAGRPVRVVVRDPGRAVDLAHRGAEVVPATRCRRSCAGAGSAWRTRRPSPSPPSTGPTSRGAPSPWGSR